MLTTLIEKIDTSPSTVAATSTASEVTTPARATSSGMPRGAEPAEQEDHGDERDRQGDRLAAEQVVLRRGAELLADEHVAADEHLGRVEVSGDVGDLVGELDLGFLVEAAGDGDDGERGAAVGGAQGVGAGRPRVGDGDDAVDGGDPLEPGAERRGDGGVVDVDAVGDDGDLAAGLGEVVEALGDAAGFGAGSGAEARRRARRRPSCRRCRRRGAARSRAVMTARRRRTTSEASEDIMRSPSGLWPASRWRRAGTNAPMMVLCRKARVMAAVGAEHGALLARRRCRRRW